jgi:hypothetical protein
MTLSPFAWAMISAETVRPSVDCRSEPFAGEQDVAQRDGVARLAGQLLDDDLVSGGNAILLAARAHDCEHGFFQLPSSFAASEMAADQGSRAGSGLLLNWARLSTPSPVPRA